MLRVAAVALLALAGAMGTSGQDRAIWLDVPFVAQPPEGCGAAAISMVMQYWAAQQKSAAPQASNVEAIQQALYDRRSHGIPASAMQAWFKDHGYRAFAVNGTWSDLREHLSKGRPLIAAIRPDGQRELHYVVLDGLDDARGIVTMNDPAVRKLLTEERAQFERDWSATHNWLLLAVPAQ